MKRHTHPNVYVKQTQNSGQVGIPEKQCTCGTRIFNTSSDIQVFVYFR